MIGGQSVVVRGAVADGVGQGRNGLHAMNAVTQPRPLSSKERAVLTLILDGYSGPGAVELRNQLHSGLAVRGPVTMLDLEVPDESPRASVADGPLSIRAIVEGTDLSYSARSWSGSVMVFCQDWSTPGTRMNLPIRFLTRRSSV